MAGQVDLATLQAAIDAIGARQGPPGTFNPNYSAVMGSQTETLFQPQWDRVNYPAAGTGSLSFFSNALGASVTLISAGATATIAKSLRDTNLVQAGVLSTKALDVRAFSVQLVPVQHAIAGANTPKEVDDRNTLWEAGALEIKIVDKQRFAIPLLPFKNLDPINPMTTATNVSINAGAGNGAGAIPLGNDAIVIPANTTIQATMTFQGSPAVSQAYDIVVFLWAYVRRPGQ